MCFVVYDILIFTFFCYCGILNITSQTRLQCIGIFPDQELSMNEAFERKRQEVLKKISQIKTQQKPKKKLESQTYSSEPQTVAKKLKVALFGKPSLFLKSLKDLTETRFDVNVFSNTTETIDSCADLPIFNVLIDIDEPTGPKPAMEIIGNLKAVAPETIFLCFTKDIGSRDALAIEQKGAILIGKPVNVNSMLKHISK
jgi:hypothetical protein